MKKNSGFSLVELIVVIAIMAVLVGVLAPAYLKYVEKSRKSTDISAISDIMTAAATVAADVEYDIPAGCTFTVAASNGNAELQVAGDTVSASAIDGWGDVANLKKADDNKYKYAFKSKEFKQAATTGSITGTVKPNGGVIWTFGATPGVFRNLYDYSKKDFGGKFSGTPAAS